MLIASLRSSIALSGVFFLLTITFLLLAVNEFVANKTVGIAGGYFGLFTAFSAWYVAAGKLRYPLVYLATR